MKTPLDCQLLSLGLKFVRSIKENDWNSISELIGSENENCLKIAKSLFENNVLRCQFHQHFMGTFSYAHF